MVDCEVFDVYTCVSTAAGICFEVTKSALATYVS